VEKAALSGGPRDSPVSDFCTTSPGWLTSAYMISCGEMKLTTRSQDMPCRFSAWPWVRSQRTAFARRVHVGVVALVGGADFVAVGFEVSNPIGRQSIGVSSR